MTTSPEFDPKEFVPAGVGFALGLGILAFLVVLGLVLGLSPALDFGVPYQ